jgi:polyhydroxyalkanoate synthesis repressor PhaR
MPVIKRYSNRKLYDTDSKRYVTLEDLGEFIRQGEDVRVVDHVSGEDLTSVTLMQVIYEEEKKIGGLLPQLFLTRLIQAGGSTVTTLRSRLASLDPFQIVDEEIRRRIQLLVEQGRIEEEEGKRLHELLVRKPSQPEAVHIPVKSVDGEEVLQPADAVDEPVNPEELELLQQQVDLLEQQLVQLKRGE